MQAHHVKRHTSHAGFVTERSAQPKVGYLPIKDVEAQFFRKRGCSVEPQGLRPPILNCGVSMFRCNYCKQELIEIGHIGERLVGCSDCNRWTWLGGRECISLALPEEDIWTLRAVVSRA